MRSKRTCHCKYEPKIHTTFALFLMTMGCLLTLIFATRAIPSYLHTKGFEEATCTVQSSQIVANVCCEASVTSLPDCLEGYSYPCAQVQVTYLRDGASKAALLYDGHHSLAYASPIEKCSYLHCYATSYETHVMKAEEFLTEYGRTGASHSCYFDPSTEETAVLDITTSVDLLHSILWPFLLCILSTIIFLIVVVIRKKRLDPLDEDNDDESSLDTESGKSDDVQELNGTPSRTSSLASMLPHREEVPSATPEKWAQEPGSKSRGSSGRPTTRSAIHFDIDTSKDGKAKGNKSKNGKKSAQPKKESKGGLNLTPVTA